MRLHELLSSFNHFCIVKSLFDFFGPKKWFYFQIDFTDDISIKAVRGSGPGGQNVNKGMAQVYSILIFLHWNKWD